MGRERTPWQRIMRAYHAGTGCRLSPEDIHRLGQDDAIETRAGIDDEEDEAERVCGEGHDWRPWKVGMQSGTWVRRCKRCTQEELVWQHDKPK